MPVGLAVAAQDRFRGFGCARALCGPVQQLRLRLGQSLIAGVQRVHRLPDRLLFGQLWIVVEQAADVQIPDPVEIALHLS